MSSLALLCHIVLTVLAHHAASSKHCGTAAQVDLEPAPESRPTTTKHPHKATTTTYNCHTTHTPNFCSAAGLLGEAFRQRIVIAENVNGCAKHARNSSNHDVDGGYKATNQASVTLALSWWRLGWLFFCIGPVVGTRTASHK